tara:strand:+ start:747 stop:1088 length:342 start_codon:yes stop_codon:yes gene_type:complete
MPDIVDLNIVQGSDYVVSMQATDDFGDVVNLTNYVVNGVVKHRFGDEGHVFSLNPSIGDATNGEIDIKLTPAETEVIPVGQYHYGIELLSGVPPTIGYKILQGLIDVQPEINR